MSQLQQFIFLESVGRGTFGECRKAIDEQKRFVVIKELCVGRAQAHIYRAECNILRSLHHPFIVRLLEEYPEDMTLVLEYAEGGTLQDYIALSKENVGIGNEVNIFFAQLCIALKYIHECGVIHRDLKPENIFLNASRTQIRLGDFGSAIRINDRSTESMMSDRCGTISYMSPEMLCGKIITKATDMWSLGCLLYEMCEKRKAFSAFSVLDPGVQRIICCEYKPMSESSPAYACRLVKEHLLVDVEQRISSHDIMLLPEVRQFCMQICMFP